MPLRSALLIGVEIVEKEKTVKQGSIPLYSLDGTKYIHDKK